MLKQLIVTAAITLALPVQAAIFDFEEFPVVAPTEEAPDPLGGTLTVEDRGLVVTFTANGLHIREGDAAFDPIYGHRYLTGGGDTAPVSATFNGRTVNSVSMINPVNGSITDEIDLFSVNAFDEAGNLLASYAGHDELIRLTAPGIFRIVIDDLLARDGDDLTPTGFLIATIAFNQRLRAPIPEPATFVFLGGGVFIIAMRRRVPKKQ